MDVDDARRRVPRRSTVLVTGASGLLGTWLLRAGPEWSAVVRAVHRRRTDADGEIRVDLRDRRATLDVIGSVRPDLVIHTAYAKDEQSIVHATRTVADAARDVGAGVIHISTDSVFRGDGVGQPETAEPDPISDYGRWKSEAEAIVRQDPTSAIVRLPLIISLDPLDHIASAIVDGAENRRPTTWFTDEVRQPAMAEDIARAIWRIGSLDPERRAGTWHLPGPERLTRLELSQRMLRALGLPADVIAAAPSPPGDDRPRDLHLLDRRARTELAWSPRRVLT